MYLSVAKNFENSNTDTGNVTQTWADYTNWCKKDMKATGNSYNHFPYGNAELTV